MQKRETLDRMREALPGAAEGVSPSELGDDDLRSELEHIYATRRDTFFDGSTQALERHTERMLELEAEYARRFPRETEPDPQRTRAGARERDGHDGDG